MERLNQGLRGLGFQGSGMEPEGNKDLKINCWVLWNAKWGNSVQGLRSATGKGED